MKNNDNMNCRMKFLYSNMRLLRRVNDISPETIAYDLHLRRSTYADYESGRRIPDLQTIDALSAYYDIELDALVNHDLSKGPLNRIYFDDSESDMPEILNSFQSLSASSRKLILERMETLLEREAVFYREYVDADLNRRKNTGKLR